MAVDASHLWFHAFVDQLLFPAFVVFHIDASLLLVVNTPCGVVTHYVKLKPGPPRPQSKT